ncbi:hypothetical protein [Pseudomonas sp. CGJS7]|uniref:hypothetical protein n=1 Tax=Pseudomonas sp. CGJS7 TaxID=3109348 RepID=UPI0030090563
MRVLSSLTLAPLFAIALAAPGAFAAERAYVPVEQRFNAEQLKATGLDTLSAQQLQLLNQLLSQDQTAVVTETVKQVRSERKGLARVEAEPVSGMLKGEFRGWSAGTVLELENGQRWRVIDGTLFVGKPRPAPKVTIRPGMMGSWYLEAEGQVQKAKVARLD